MQATEELARDVIFSPERPHLYIVPRFGFGGVGLLDALVEVAHDFSHESADVDVRHIGAAFASEFAHIQTCAWRDFAKARAAWLAALDGMGLSWQDGEFRADFLFYRDRLYPMVSQESLQTAGMLMNSLEQLARCWPPRGGLTSNRPGDLRTLRE